MAGFNIAANKALKESRLGMLADGKGTNRIKEQLPSDVRDTSDVVTRLTVADTFLFEDF